MALLSPLPLGEARELGARFGLDVAHVEPLAAGSVNSNFRFRAADGAAYFARIYEEQGFAGAEIELRLLRILAEEGVPVVCPLGREKNGCAEFRGKPFAVFPWVDGDWLCLRSVTPVHCEKLGVALARVHLASGRVGELPEGRFRPGDMLGRLARVGPSAPPSLLAEIASIRNAYAKYQARRVALPNGVCHGDLFRDNVLWRSGDVAALLDFESASQGPFVYDLMVTALAWCFTDALVLDNAEALFRGYRSARTLEQRELDALEVEGALACLRFATTRITDFELRAAPSAPPARDFRRFLRRLEALEAGAFDSLRRHLS